MADTSRIEQFRKMASDDPGNALGHFSLGRELLNAGRAEEAVPSFERVIQIDPNLSRAYQLLGTALLRLDRRDEAISRLTEGLKIAHERGGPLRLAPAPDGGTLATVELPLAPPAS